MTDRKGGETMDEMDVLDEDGVLYLKAADVLTMLDKYTNVQTVRDNLRVLVMTATELTTTETR